MEVEKETAVDSIEPRYFAVIYGFMELYIEFWQDPNGRPSTLVPWTPPCLRCFGGGDGTGCFSSVQLGYGSLSKNQLHNL